MSAYPAYGTLIRFSEKPGISPVLRSQFERGPIKQTKILSKQQYLLSVQYVYTIAEYSTWKTWYDATVNRGADFFTVNHPITGGVIDARIVEGKFSTSPYNAAQTHVLVTMEWEYYA